MSQKDSKVINWVVGPSKGLVGEFTLPGDKSISHRSIMLGALSEGITTIRGFLQGEDCLATKSVFQKMGITIESTEDLIKINGCGLFGLKEYDKSLYFGNSGTGMRLMSGILSGQSFESTLIGDSSLMSRPMGRIMRPLKEMGAKINSNNGEVAPIKISPANLPLKGITYEQSISSAQVKSAILFAGLYANEPVTVIEPGVSRDHTERMLNEFGADVISTITSYGKVKTTLSGNRKLLGRDIEVPVDISSAAFFIVATLITESSRITLKKVGINPSRVGVLHILKEMGAKITLLNKRLLGSEPVADILIESSRLKNITVKKEWIASAIDEFPIIFIAAACADGTFSLRGAKELRVKESDRIAAMAEGLEKLGVSLKVYDDGIDIFGSSDMIFDSGEIFSKKDHRIAMSFVVAACKAKGEVEVKDCGNVSTSFPLFLKKVKEMGINISENTK